MRKSFRVTAGVALATAGLLASGIAGATTTPRATKFPDAIGKNDLKLKSRPATQLEIGGSSFDGPLVQAAQIQWNGDVHGSAPIATYAITKSGTGRSDMLSGTYNVGFSDFPLNYNTTPDVGPGATAPYDKNSVGQFVQVPVVLGGVAVEYHFGTGISGAEATLINKYGLTLNGKVTGEIFAGKITNWDSAAIGALNKDLYIKGKDVLPNLPIVVESRTSGSGTTFGFKDYLSEVDPADFPTGGATPNPNSNAFSAAAATFANSALLDAAVHTTNGAIGYVEYGYAVANGVATANLVNRSGKTVKLSEKGIAEAATVGLAYIAKHGGWNTNPGHLSGFEINNEIGATVYPISLVSFAMLYKAQTNKVNAITEVKFLDFLVHSAGGKSAATTFGQDLADENGYVPLPATLQAVARKLLLGVKFGSTVVLNATD